MAKKRKKRRPAPRPATAAAPETPSARQERKEAARREREQRIKRARRRTRLRRLGRFAIVAAVLGAIVGIVLIVRAQSGKELQAADAAAERLGCSEIQEKPNALDEVPSGEQHQPPYEYEEHPATSGRHSQPLPSDTSVYEDPIDASLEAQAVHNLEHGYVFMYYQQEGPNALAEPVVERLQSLAESERKVVVAPYYQMPEGTSLAFTAWQRLQTCPSVEDAGAVAQVAQGFIERFRGGGLAPEPNAA